MRVSEMLRLALAVALVSVRPEVVIPPQVANGCESSVLPAWPESTSASAISPILPGDARPLEMISCTRLGFAVMRLSTCDVTLKTLLDVGISAPSLTVRSRVTS